MQDWQHVPECVRMVQITSSLLTRVPVARDEHRCRAPQTRRPLQCQVARQGHASPLQRRSPAADQAQAAPAAISVWHTRITATAASSWCRVDARVASRYCPTRVPVVGSAQATSPLPRRLLLVRGTHWVTPRRCSAVRACRHICLAHPQRHRDRGELLVPGRRTGRISVLPDARACRRIGTSDVTTAAATAHDAVLTHRVTPRRCIRTRLSPEYSFDAHGTATALSRRACLSPNRVHRLRRRFRNDRCHRWGHASPLLRCSCRWHTCLV
jgi:hypothetical protein